MIADFRSITEEEVRKQLKKLAKAGLVGGRKQGKEVFYATSDMGQALCLRYREVREAYLFDAFSALGEIDAESLADLSRQLRVLSGLYGQAARSATNL